MYRSGFVQNKCASAVKTLDSDEPHPFGGDGSHGHLSELRRTVPPRHGSGRLHAWLRQAHSDPAMAASASEGGFHAQACYHCSQAAEKALKALLKLRLRRK